MGGSEWLRPILKARAEDYFFNHLVSAGVPHINGFELKVYAPCPFTHDFPPAVFKLTSAGILPFVFGDDGAQVILVRMNRDDTVEWEIPSGHVEVTDPDIFHTARRECLEETGINPGKIYPLTYAVRKEDEAGIQFLTHFNEPLNVTRRDELGRGYLDPLPGAFTEEIAELALEPLPIFLDPKQSLLRTSRHGWAYRGIRGALEEKMSLAGLAMMEV